MSKIGSQTAGLDSAARMGKAPALRAAWQPGCPTAAGHRPPFQAGLSPHNLVVGARVKLQCRGTGTTRDARVCCQGCNAAAAKSTHSWGALRAPRRLSPTRFSWMVHQETSALGTPQRRRPAQVARCPVRRPTRCAWLTGHHTILVGSTSSPALPHLRRWSSMTCGAAQRTCCPLTYWIMLRCCVGGA